MPELAKADLELAVAAARLDCAVYMALVHRTDTPELDGGWALPAPHHKLIIDALMGEGHRLIIAPRGSAKTTLVQGWLEWELGRASLQGGSWANDFRVIYISHSAHAAYKVSNAVMATIEGNDLYHAVFPAVKPHTKKWSQEEWKVKGNTKKDSTFQAFGIGSVPLGSRADRIVLDDIGDKENMGTSYQREQVIDTLEHAVKPMLVPWGRFVMACTKWAWDDPAAWAEQQGWQTLKLKAIVTDEEGREQSYWAERFALPWLQAERRASPKAFARQYQNEVAPEEGLVFKREWFANRFDLLPQEVISRKDSWDTASGEGRNRAYSVGLSAVVTPDYHLYVWNMFRGQIDYSELRQAMLWVHRQNSSDEIIVEKKSSGHAAVQDSWLAHLPITEWQPFGQRGSPSRLAAAEAVTDFCGQGFVHLPSEYFCRQAAARGLCPPDWIFNFERELFTYEGTKASGQSFDVVDALAQLIYRVWMARNERRLDAQRREGTPLLWGHDRRERKYA